MDKMTFISQTFIYILTCTSGLYISYPPFIHFPYQRLNKIIGNNNYIYQNVISE